MAPKQKGSSTSTQQTTYPDWVTDSQQNLDKWRDQYFSDTMGRGGSPVAGMNPTQGRAGEWYGALLEDDGPDYSSAIMAAGAPVTGREIVDGMNPFLGSVGRDTMAAVGRNHGNRAAEIGARAAARSAFGGSGEAIERAQLNRSTGETTREAISSLLSGGYDRSAQLADSNANRRLSAATAASGARINELNRRSQAADSMLRYGTLQQAQSQSEADRIRSLLDWYQGGIPGAGSTTNTTDPIWGNPMESILGLVF